MFEPSSYQQQVFDRIAAGQGNTVIEAVAGSGKTTTIIEALRHMPPGGRVVLLAYGAPIAKEMSRRVSGRAHVRTMHSLGLAALRRAGECEMDEKKTGRILSGWLSGSDGRTFREMLHLVSLAKATLVDAHDAVAVREMADRYGLMIGPDEPLDEMIAILPDVLDGCRRDAAHADFDDMIWLPLVNNIAVEEFDWVFVDEAQDLNPAQIQLLLRAAGSWGHVVAIGDRYQSMYGFRGADVNAIPAIIEATNAVTLPLSITYRCPTKHVELAQTIVPHIEARPGAPAGTVSYVDAFKFSSQLRDGDMVICRTNAPLMSYALELIADGVKAVVCGKDIGASLAALARALSVDAPSMAQMHANLGKHEEREQRRLASGGVSETAMSMMQDKVDALAVIMDECATPGEVTARIKSLFSEDRGSVTFSTVHGAKGLEAERVFILRPDLMPLTRARQAWEQQQERNIEYVAYTRSKSELYFVEEGE